jgi:hypothetical protein
MEHTMSQQDLYLVIGIIVTAFAIPTILGAMTEHRSPRISTVLILIGGGLILLAFSQRAGGYALAEIPEAFVRVVAYFIR